MEIKICLQNIGWSSIAISVLENIYLKYKLIDLSPKDLEKLVLENGWDQKLANRVKTLLY